MSGPNARNAVVIGGASGIGRAVAHALAADNCRVTVADRNTDGARAVGAELGAWTRPNGLRIQRKRVPIGQLKLKTQNAKLKTASVGRQFVEIRSNSSRRF